MPIILYTLIAMTFLPMLLALTGGYLRARQCGHFDNNHPRLQQAQLTGAGARALAAQANAWEALALYTAVVFIAFAAGVDLHPLNTIAIAFIIFRVLHAVFYLANLATLRSVAFALGMGCCLYILYGALTHA